MNTINFNQTGGFPLSTLILSELQNAFSIFNALGAIAGDKTIISGCVTTGSLVSPGVVCIDGEVLEFKGGTVQTKVKVIEAIESLLFEDNVSKPVIRYRYVQFGTGVGAMDWADFKRPLETKTIATLLERIEDLEARPLVGNIPIGLVAIWGQAANLIPIGWEEYAELSGRFPIGFSGADVDFDVVGKTGGAKSKTLSVPEMPEHDHAIGNSRRNTGGGSGGDENHPASFAGTRTHITDTQGTGKSFSIMNPYRVVHFIKYVG